MLYGWNGAKFSNHTEKESIWHNSSSIISGKIVNFEFCQNSREVKLLTNENLKFSVICLALARRNSLFWSFFFCLNDGTIKQYIANIWRRGFLSDKKKQHIEHVGNRRDHQKSENSVIKSDVLYLYFSFFIVLQNKEISS